MDTEEVAKYLKSNRKPVTSLVRRKPTEASKVGRDWRFRKSDVDEYLERKSNSLEMTRRTSHRVDDSQGKRAE